MNCNNITINAGGQPYIANTNVTVGTTGCFISKSYNADELAGLIRKALAFEGKTNGRERIIELGLSNDLIAKRLMGIYNLIIAD